MNRFIDNALRVSGRSAMGFDLFESVGSAFKAVGYGITHPADDVTGAVDIVSSGANKVSEGLDFIPIIGPLYSALWSYYTSPLDLLDNIAQGVPIDRAAMATIQDNVKQVKTIAPYAQMVMQLVPGVGPIASGAISAGIALAQGQTVDQALIEGVKGMIPGGPLAKAAFDVGASAMKGEDLKGVGISAIQSLAQQSGISLPPDTAKYLAAGVSVAQGVAEGKPVATALVDEAIAQLPPDYQEAALEAQRVGNGAKLSDILLEQAESRVGTLGGNAKQFGDALQVGIALGSAEHFQSQLATEVKNGGITLRGGGYIGQLAADEMDRVNQAALVAAASAKRAAVVKASSGRVVTEAQKKRAATVQASSARAGGPQTSVNAAHIAQSLKEVAALSGFPWGDYAWQQAQGFAGEGGEPSQPEDVAKGFLSAVHLLNLGAGRYELSTVRDSLTGPGKRGFDTGLAFSIGRAHSRLDESGDPMALAGYYVMRGVSGLPAQQAAHIVEVVAVDPEARKGVLYAMNQA